MQTPEMVHVSDKVLQIPLCNKRKRTITQFEQDGYIRSRNTQNQLVYKHNDISQKKPQTILIKSLKLKTRALLGYKKENARIEESTLKLTDSLKTDTTYTTTKNFEIKSELSITEKLATETSQTNDTDVEQNDPKNETPNKKFIIDPTEIADYEKRANSEFFLNKLNKTPERYMKIRNFILEKWEEIKPNYLTKVASRTGLGCGDVNAIGRIHSWMEKIGVINLGVSPPKHYTSRLTGILQAHKVKSKKHERVISSESKPSNVKNFLRQKEFDSIYTRNDNQGYAFRNNKVSKPTNPAVDFCISSPNCFCEFFCSCKNKHKTNRIPINTELFTNDYDWVCSKLKLSANTDNLKQKTEILSYSSEKTPPFTIKMDTGVSDFLELHFLVSKGKCFGNIGGCFDDEKNTLYLTMCFPALTGVDSLDKNFDSRGFKLVGFYGSEHSYDMCESYATTCEISKLVAFQEFKSHEAYHPFISVNVDFKKDGCWAKYIEYDKNKLQNLGL
ncbi:hypothetical protein BB561_004860 [Smittium simulii]|uniref:SWIRM domain-containing protein n=1 Tax=Smittium simulii TaxID=133385 RepID=A0A2T9YDS9_9FUNG|nr:hypothetical protein BB561_004860 [Smittium simulii]